LRRGKAVRTIPKKQQAVLTVAAGRRDPIVSAESSLKIPIHCSAVLRKPNGPLRREQRTKRDINSSCFCSRSAACITGLLLSGGRKQGSKNGIHRGVEKLLFSAGVNTLTFLPGKELVEMEPLKS